MTTPTGGDNVVVIASEDGQAGLALAALIAEGDLEGAHALSDSPITIAAVYGIAQAIEGFHLGRTGQPVEWPLIAAALRDNVQMIAERREELENPSFGTE